MAFRGNVALVTGGGSGMGQRACERLAAGGATVVALDVDEEGLAKTSVTNERIHTFVCDVTDLDRLREIVEQVETDLGLIDRTLAAAAIMPTSLLAEHDIEQIHRVMDIDYKGVVNTVLTTLPGMLERRRGDMIVFASLMGYMPVMYLGAYCAAKAAVKQFTEILYHENRDRGVRFALVAPPMVNTPLLDQVTTGLKSLERAKPLSPDEVLDAIEEHLEKGRFEVLPGQARVGSLSYRLIPKLVWKNMHDIEGI